MKNHRASSLVVPLVFLAALIASHSAVAQDLGAATDIVLNGTRSTAARVTGVIGPIFIVIGLLHFVYHLISDGQKPWKTLMCTVIAGLTVSVASSYL